MNDQNRYITKMLKKPYTLVFLRNDCQVLLGLKKRGFGVNKWYGFGGKVEPNEAIIDAAARELKEECCVSVETNNLKNVAHIEFTFEDDPVTMEVHVFTATVFKGTPVETEEMIPKWFTCDQIPYNDMWPADMCWFPYMLDDKPFYAAFHYKGFDKILHYKFEEVESMEAFYDNYVSIFNN